MYSKSDIATIVQRANELAIRVIPEFDNPGNSRSIGYDPEFRDVILCFEKNCTYGVPGAYRINGGPPTGVFDPSNSDSYTLLRSILEEF